MEVPLLHPRSRPFLLIHRCVQLCPIYLREKSTFNELFHEDYAEKRTKSSGTFNKHNNNNAATRRLSKGLVCTAMKNPRLSTIYGKDGRTKKSLTFRMVDFSMGFVQKKFRKIVLPSVCADSTPRHERRVFLCEFDTKNVFSPDING